VKDWQTKSDAACDVSVGVFAVWTLSAHATTFLGGSLDDLLWLFGVAAAILGFVAWRFRGAGAVGSTKRAGGDSTAPPHWQRAAVVAVAACCALLVAWGVSLEIVWALAAGLAVVLSARELLAAEDSGAPTRARSTGLGWISALALGCAVIALVSHRPDADDGFYLNLAVAAADDPTAALLANDTLHRIPDVPLPLPVYRVHSLELLQAALSRVSGAAVLDVAHLWLAALAALAVPFAFARLHRRLLPGAWPWATVVSIAVLLFTSSASHGWSNFGLVRLHQGKALLLTLLLPLTIAYGIEFAQRSGLRPWLRLAAVQIAAVGVSASGLWLAPIVAGTALLAGNPCLRTARARRRLAAGLAASGYVLVLALALRGVTTATFESAAIQSPALEFSSLTLSTQALRTVIGPGLAGGFALFAALGAWAFALQPLTRRLCAFSAAAALLLWNPFAASFIAAHLTSAPTYWRVLWLLPVPVLIAVVLAAPIERSGPAKPAVALSAAAALLLFATAVALRPEALAPSAANQVRIAAPGWKLPPSELETARWIVEATTTTDRVLAPKHVAPWLPTFHEHPTPLVVRREYLPVLHEALGPEELSRRMHLLGLVSGSRTSPHAAEMLRATIVEDGLAIVCLADAARRRPDLRQVLRETGFQVIRANADYEVWKRSPTL